jgi:hypothetical protein
MSGWQLVFFGACAAVSVSLLNSIHDALVGIRNSIDAARSEADSHHERLLSNLYNLAKATKAEEEDDYFS